MAWLLIPTHAAALVAWLFATKWEVKRNAALIAADGAANSLHEGFHRVRSLYRLTVVLLIATTASLPLWPRALPMAASAAGLLLLFGGYFLRVFNPALSIARGLPADYVSAAHGSAYFDRFIWWLTDKLHGGVVLRGYVSNTYWLVLNAVFCAGVAGYLACVALLCVWR